MVTSEGDFPNIIVNDRLVCEYIQNNLIYKPANYAVAHVLQLNMISFFNSLY